MARVEAESQLCISVAYYNPCTLRWFAKFVTVFSTQGGRHVQLVQRLEGGELRSNLSFKMGAPMRLLILLQRMEADLRNGGRQCVTCKAELEDRRGDVGAGLAIGAEDRSPAHLAIQDGNWKARTVHGAVCRAANWQQAHHKQSTITSLDGKIRAVATSAHPPADEEILLVAEESRRWSTHSCNNLLTTTGIAVLPLGYLDSATK
ncbi:hypothetical protein KCU87_g514, partial [Aureobasidium melanogenum]